MVRLIGILIGFGFVVVAAFSLITGVFTFFTTEHVEDPAHALHEEPRDFTFDMHGHTTPKDAREEMTVATYKQGSGLKANGALTAPFDGIQGWLFVNGAQRPVIVRLRLAGFYDLVPLGAPGNESRVRANVPAAEARRDTPFQAP